MKRFSILFSLMALFSLLTAQAPQSFTYQTVVRGSDNQPLTNTVMGVRLSILKTSSGQVSYMESHHVTSNINGLVSLVVGTGQIATGSPTFNSINWGQSLSLKVEIDPTGGTSYTIIKEEPIVSVPYAIYANEVEEDSFSGNYNDLYNKPTFPTVPVNVSAFINDPPYITDANIGQIASSTIYDSLDSRVNSLQDQVLQQEDLLDSLAVVTDSIVNGGFLCGLHKVVDFDGNVYNTVQMDKQCWMRENLRVRHFSDGTEIPWGNSSNFKDGNPYCYHFIYAYANNPGYTEASTGLHYNWFAAMNRSTQSNSVPSGVQGVCPNGWHIPSMQECQVMVNYVKSRPEYTCNNNPTSIAKALSAQFSRWPSCADSCTVGWNVGDNNLTLMSIVPTGDNSLTVTGLIVNHYYTSHAKFWTSTKNRNFYIQSTSKSVTFESSSVYNAMPVRCVRDELSYHQVRMRLPALTTLRAYNVTDTTFIAGCNILSDGNSLVTSKGVCWSTQPHPTVNDPHTEAGIGETGSFKVKATGLNLHTIYYYRAYATNAVGTAYGDEFSVSTTWDQMDSLVCPDAPAVADIDGNIYSTVKIGEQCWMRENLRVTRFPDGKMIPLCDDWTIRSDSLPIRYPPAKDSTKVPVYGYLYNWNAAMNGEAPSNTIPSGVRGICPAGWHIPSRAEQWRLQDYVSALDKYRCMVSPSHVWRVATSMASNFGWASCSTGCTPGYDSSANNATGLTICPAGSIIGNVQYSFIGGEYGFGTFGGMISSTLDYNDHYNKYATPAFGLNYYDGRIGGATLFYRKDAISIRCLQDYEPAVPACQLPTVITGEVSNITESSATVDGIVHNSGGCNVTERGVCWSLFPAPTTDDSTATAGSGTGEFSCQLTNLAAETNYYVRAYAINEEGIVYGEERQLLTTDSVIPGPSLPVVTTYPVTDILLTSVVSGGIVNSDGGALVSEYGLCWDYNPNPTINDFHVALGTGVETFTYTITNLYQSLPYHVRAYAINSVGISYGEDIAFQTAAPEPQSFNQICPGSSIVFDYDSNIYNTVRIGNQCWMKENLRTTHYQDGTEIPLASGYSTLPACYSPGGSSNNVPQYGYLYNWTAVMNNASSSAAVPSGVQGICPTGWHVPSKAEFQELYTFVTGQTSCLCRNEENNVALSLVDDPGIYWAVGNDVFGLATENCSPVGGFATYYPNRHDQVNATGFSARAAGFYGIMDSWSPSYINFTANAFFWVTTWASGETSPNCILLDFRFPGLYESTNYAKEVGMSVRCVRDLPVVCKPTVETSTVSDITGNSAQAGGRITHLGGSTLTQTGLVWSMSPNPTLADFSISTSNPTTFFTLDMTNLQSNTFYYVRAFALTSTDTAYGDEVKFFVTAPNSPYDGKPCPSGAFVFDYDGNQYATIQFGEQCWMRQNLRTTHFYDGTEIQLCDTLSNTLPCRYFPNGNAAYSYYGYLYNWKAVCAMVDTVTDAVPSGIQGICPIGWHVPSSGEWQQLHDYLSAQVAYNCDTIPGNYGQAVASTILWKPSDGDYFVGSHQATNNTSGFDVYPLGRSNSVSDNHADFPIQFGIVVRYWTVTRQSSMYMKSWQLLSNESHFTQALNPKKGGAAVRCVKDL